MRMPPSEYLLLMSYSRYGGERVENETANFDAIWIQGTARSLPVYVNC